MVQTIYRDKDDWSYTLTSEPVLFADRGYTGHEHLEQFGVINMNGRLYDPLVGRFLSPDNYIAAPGYTQSYNRYSYCLNNPLKYTDPSGNYPRELGPHPTPVFSGTDYMSYNNREYNWGSGGGLGLFYSNTPHIAGWKAGEYTYDSNTGTYTNGLGQEVNDLSEVTTTGNQSAIWLIYETAYKNSNGVFVGNGNYGVIRKGIMSSTGLYPSFQYFSSAMSFLNAAEQGDNTGFRAPDFYSLNVTVAISNPITATIVGWSGSISIDRHVQIFTSPYGGSIGKSAFVASASLTANWMLQSNKPSAQETYNFLSGHGISIGGGYYGGVNWAISPTNSSTKNALGIGAYTPQIGASYNYTPEYLIFNKQ